MSIKYIFLLLIFCACTNDKNKSVRNKYDIQQGIEVSYKRKTTITLPSLIDSAWVDTSRYKIDFNKHILLITSKKGNDKSSKLLLFSKGVLEIDTVVSYKDKPKQSIVNLK